MAERYKPLHPLKEEKTELKEGRSFETGYLGGGPSYKEVSNGVWESTVSLDDEDMIKELKRWIHEGDADIDSSIREDFADQGILITDITDKKLLDYDDQNYVAEVSFKVNEDPEWAKALKRYDDSGLEDAIMHIDSSKLKDVDKRRLVGSAQKLVRLLQQGFLD